MIGAGAAGVIFVGVAARFGANLAAGTDWRLGLAVHLLPWLLMASASMAGTLSRFEDPLLRRRALAGGVFALLFVAAGAISLQTPFLLEHRSVWLREALLIPTNVIFTVWWVSYMFFKVNVFNGAGPWVDERLTNWFGAPVTDSDTALRAREKGIREAAGLEERHRLARDLHDSIKQEIFAIHTSAATAQARFEDDPSGAREALDQVRRSSRDAMTEMEAMLDRLHAAPLENTGLVAALKKQCEALALRTGAKVTCDVHDLPASKWLPPDAHENLFRIAQEALSNIGRHARATEVHVTLAPAERRLLLKIEDNGQGFDRKNVPEEARLGMGMRNMLARARAIGATFEVETRPGEGAAIYVAVPVLLSSSAGLTRGMKWTMGVFFGVPVCYGLYLLVRWSPSSLLSLGLLALLIYVQYRLDRRRSIRKGKRE
jgi:signal transduction histidine kinase